jgi:GR25 family glycosyltransferase involved in LPS biosynthesis
MNIIVISLERAKERREQMETQLKKLNIEAIMFNCFDVANIKNPTFGAKFTLPGGYRYGEDMKPGEIACTLSHIMALNMAKALNWEYVIILEDDVILAEDFEKRIKLLLNILPKNWEHVYLSGIPRFNTYFMNSNLLQLIPSTKDKVNRVDGTCAFIIRNIAYDRFIVKLSSLETTPDDLINHFIFAEQQIKSYIYFPFVAFVNDEYTYIGETKNNRIHPSKQFYIEKI